MRVLTRYIASTILASTALVLAVLLALYTFIDFVTELEDLGKGEYGLAEIARYISLSMPKRIYELLPIAALLGSVVGLGNLASQSELVVMRAAGLSMGKINSAVILVAVVLFIVALFMGEVVRPITEQKAQTFQSLAQTGTVSMQSNYGFWTRDGNHFNHIEYILPNGQFKGISIYQFDDQQRLRKISKAEQASHNSEVWILEQVVHSRIDERSIQVQSEATQQWQSTLNPGMLNVVVVPPEFLPVWSLLDYIQYLKANQQASNRYQLAFWSKLMMPLSAAVMVFIAVPFIFGPLRSSPIGGRVLAGALAGIGFHLFNQMFQHMGLVFGLWPFMSAALPTFLFAGLGIILMRRVH